MDSKVETKHDTKANNYGDVPINSQNEIGKFDMLGYWCTPQLGMYSNYYNINEPLVVARLPSAALSQFQPDVQNAARECPKGGETLGQDGFFHLRKLNGTCAFPKGLTLPHQGRGAITFSFLQAAEGFFVTFSQGPYPFDPMIEVCFGAWGNTQSYIRYKRDGPLIAVSKEVAKPETSYWISVYDGQVCVGYGDAKSTGDPSTVFMCGVVPVPPENPDRKYNNSKHREWALPLNRVTNVGLGTWHCETILIGVKVHALANPVQVQTPSIYSILPKHGNYVFPNNLQLPTPGCGAFSFEICDVADNIWVGITNGPYIHDCMINVIFGGWDNQRIAIRKQNRGEDICIQNHVTRTNCPYWISVTPIRIAVGMGEIGSNVLMWCKFIGYNQTKQISFGGWETEVKVTNCRVFEIEEKTEGEISVLGERKDNGLGRDGRQPGLERKTQRTPQNKEGLSQQLGHLKVSVESKASESTDKSSQPQPEVSSPTTAETTKQQTVEPDIFIVVHSKPATGAWNILSHTWAWGPELNLRSDTNVTKHLWVGMFDTMNVGEREDWAGGRALEDVGLNLDGCAAVNKLSLRRAIIHDLALSPNNVQFDLFPGGVQWCVVVMHDDGRLGGPPRTCVSFHVVPGDNNAASLFARSVPTGPNEDTPPTLGQFLSNLERLNTQVGGLDGLDACFQKMRQLIG